MIKLSHLKRKKELLIFLVNHCLILGYAGYVHAIKSENLHADTFGRITYDVNNDNFIRGQDYAPPHKYVSTQTKVNIPPSEMLRRTAADIVGIPNKEIKIH